MNNKHTKLKILLLVCDPVYTEGSHLKPINHYLFSIHFSSLPRFSLAILTEEAAIEQDGEWLFFHNFC